jgi:hypothetical protein
MLRLTVTIQVDFGTPKETGHALRPRIGPPLSQGTTITSTAYRPWYVGRSELEHWATRKQN